METALLISPSEATQAVRAAETFVNINYNVSYQNLLSVSVIILA